MAAPPSPLPRSASSNKSPFKSSTLTVAQTSEPHYPTTQEVESWDETLLLEWIQKTLKVLLKNDDAEKFLNARLEGSVFLRHAGQVEIFLKAGIALGPSDKLAHLAQTVVDVDSKFSSI